MIAKIDPPSLTASQLARNLRKVVRVERLQAKRPYGVVYRVTYDDGKTSFVKKAGKRYQVVDAKHSPIETPVKLSGRQPISADKARGRGKLIYERVLSE